MMTRNEAIRYLGDCGAVFGQAQGLEPAEAANEWYMAMISLGVSDDEIRAVAMRAAVEETGGNDA